MSRYASFMMAVGGLVLAGILVTSGCASPPEEEPVPLPEKLTTKSEHKEKMMTGLAEVQAGLAALKQKTDSNMAALKDLVQPPHENMKASYEAYCKAMDDLDADYANLLKVGDETNLQAAAFFKMWDQELAGITNPDLKEDSEERKAKIEIEYKRIQQGQDANKKAYDELQKVLRDIKRYLSVDLSPDSLEGIDSFVKKAGAEAETISERTDIALKDIANLTTYMSSAAPR